jgi:integrase
LLSRVFTLAVERREARGNPCSEVDLLKGEVKRTRHLLPDERKRLIEALSIPRRSHVLAAVELDLHTGLRRGELLGLRVEDVDFHRTGTKIELDRSAGSRFHIKEIFSAGRLTRARARSTPALGFGFKHF